ncbi:NKG2-A/NKG2-B type II integral membrane protein-like [Octodon degus]|uniref:NKG2-A/NKG2-B type II integral membrane protein-like n=1 Tax=Octodon degus TaxID=10160 RepID=A0A6P6E289_OCTDE|nr:NKG2-A/NKG2-B type II integral membrane protein-like [Octodon degus]
MSNQQVMYSELNLAKDPKKQWKKSKGTKSSTAENKQEVTYAELTLQSASQEHQENGKDHGCRDSISPPEKLLAGFLGATCLVLVVTVTVLVIVVSPSTTTQQQNKSSSVGTRKETHGLSTIYHCAHCPNEWFTFSNNCHYFGLEKKTWNESLLSCTSKNSSLTYIDDEKEMKFLSSISRASWIGISRSGRDHPWLLVNGSVFHLQIQESSPGESNCAWLTISGLMAEDCGSPQPYYCKHKFQN